MLSSQFRVSLTHSNVIDFAIFKMGHMLEYGILLFFNYQALRNTFQPKVSSRSVVNFLLVSFLLTLAYAFLDEIHQLFVPTREGRIRDVFFDGLGAAVAGGLLWKLKPIRRKKPKK